MPLFKKSAVARALALMAGTVIPSAGFAQTATFHGLGFLNHNLPESAADAISADGTVVVGYSAGAGTSAFRWSATTGMLSLGPGWGEAFNVSGDGAVIVGTLRGPSSTTTAGIWTKAGGTQSLGFLPGGTNSGAFGVSRDGQVVVGDSNGTGVADEGFYWTAVGGMVPMGSLSTSPVNAGCNAVSGDGLTAVGATLAPDGHSTEGFYWTAETGMVGIGDISGGPISAYVNNCNYDGTTIVGVGVGSSNVDSAMLWTKNTGIVDVGSHCATCYDSHCYAVSDDGTTIGGASADTNEQGTAALWTAQTGWRNINRILEDDFGVYDADGWVLESVTGMSADGQTIVGRGNDPQGRYEAWIAFIPRPAPCPPDVNGDRGVDLSDLALLLSKFGATPASSSYSLACDLDRNGVVDLGDLGTVLANFGENCP